MQRIEALLAVQRAIERLVRERTVIVIAHRLSTIVGADSIVVIEEGRVVQQGTHAALISMPGRYHALWQAHQQVKRWHATHGIHTTDGCHSR